MHMYKYIYTSIYLCVCNILYQLHLLLYRINWYPFFSTNPTPEVSICSTGFCKPTWRTWSKLDHFTKFQRENNRHLKPPDFNQPGHTTGCLKAEMLDKADSIASIWCVVLENPSRKNSGVLVGNNAGWKYTTMKKWQSGNLHWGFCKFAAGNPFV